MLHFEKNRLYFGTEVKAGWAGYYWIENSSM